MKLASSLILPVLLGLAAAGPVHAKIERTIEKTFTVQPGGTLQVQTSGGEIRVEPSADAVVKITAKETIKADSEAEADELLQKLTLTFDQQGNTVTAIARYEEPPVFHFGSWPPVSVSFIVTVPPSFAANLRTSGGSITVGDLGGALRAHTSGGSLQLGRIGGEINAETSGGPISLGSAGGAVNLRTSGGGITTGRLAGPAELRTSGGSIRVQSAEDTLQASTSGGSVQASFTGAIKGDSAFRTSGGSIRVTVDPKAAFNLDAGTSGGGVEAEGLTITIARGGMGRNQLSGSVNGGGPSLTLGTSGGSIEIETR
jgi:hypothetical protein